MNSRVNFLMIIGALLIVVIGCARTEPPADWQRAVKIAGDLDHPAALNTDGDYLYFVTGGTVSSLNEGSGGVWRLKTDGGVAERIFAGTRSDNGTAILPGRFALAVDDKYVYWSSGTIWRTPKSGGESEPLAPASPTLLEADEKNLYWFNFAGPGDPPRPIFSSAKSSNQAAAVTRAATVSGLATDAEFIYWSEKTGVYRISKNGGAELKLFGAEEPRFVSGLAADAQNLYFTLGDGRNDLMRIPKAGGEAVRLVGPVNIAHRFFSDGRFVYFVRNEDSFSTAIARIPTGGGSAEMVDKGYISAYCVGSSRIFVADIKNIYAIKK